MSDINGDQHRTRRRAVRSVGPPVEESDDVQQAAGSPAGAGSSGVVSAGAAAKVGDAGAATAKSATTGAASDEVASNGAGSGGTATPRLASAEAAKSESVKSAASKSEDARAVVDRDEVGTIPQPPATESAVDLHKADADSEDAGSENVDSDSDTDESKPKTPVRRIVALAAAAVVVLALVVGAGASVFLTRSADQRDERRAEYVQTARQAVLNLTTIRADSAKEDIDRILSLASGQFKSEFDGRVDPFMSIVQQAKVVSNGEVVEAAVQQDDENSAQVLVAAKQTLTNAGQAEPQTRYYRFRVTVTRSDSGLTASKVEFVA